MLSSCLGHQPGAGDVMQDFRDAFATAAEGLVGCFRASEEAVGIYEQATESNSSEYRQ